MLTWEIKAIAAMCLVAALFGAYEWIGHEAVSDYKLSIAVAQAEANRKQEATDNKITVDHEKQKETRRENAKVVTKIVEKVVLRDVYRGDCIDNDGVRIANDAITGKNPRESSDGLSATK